MFQAPIVRKIPEECQGYTGRQRKLKTGSLSVTVPSVAEDEKIRWLIERGMSLSDAYKEAGAAYIIPDVALRKCIELVFKTPYFDFREGTWKTSPGQYTCVGFQKCLQEYATGQAAFPEKSLSDRRLRIAPGVYAPSNKEEACIKENFMRMIPLHEAYLDCGAIEILPGWSGALDFISNAFITAISKNLPFPSLYELTKRSHQLFAIQPTPISPAPSSTPPLSLPPDDKDDKDKTPWALYGIIAGVILLLFSE